MKTLIGICSVCLLMLSAIAFGQDNSTENPPVDQAEPLEELDEAEVVPELVFDDDEVLETDEQAAESQESNDRFIPSEEISQDLGVSFPANI